MRSKVAAVRLPKQVTYCVACGFKAGEQSWPNPEEGCWLLNIDFITFSRILFGKYFF